MLPLCSFKIAAQKYYRLSMFRFLGDVLNKIQRVLFG